MLYCGHKQLAKDTKYLSYAILHWLSTNLNDVLGNKDFRFQERKYRNDLAISTLSY